MKTNKQTLIALCILLSSSCGNNVPSLNGNKNIPEFVVSLIDMSKDDAFERCRNEGFRQIDDNEFSKDGLILELGNNYGYVSDVLVEYHEEVSQSILLDWIDSMAKCKLEIKSSHCELYYENRETEYLAINSLNKAKEIIKNYYGTDCDFYCFLENKQKGISALFEYETDEGIYFQVSINE